MTCVNADTHAGENHSVFSSLSSFEQRVIALQMGKRNFSAELIHSVAFRCHHSCPQVIACYPMHNGKPFPTLFWLTCPHLVYRCGVLESQGGVQELERYLLAQKERKDAYARFNKFYARQRTELISVTDQEILRNTQPALWKRIETTGVGGIHDVQETCAVKCLHVQTASWLALRSIQEHPAAPWLESHLGLLSCETGFCLRQMQRNVPKISDSENE